MTRPTASDLDQFTAAADLWLRRCNNRPADGVPVSRTELRAVLGVSAGVHLDKQGRIAWISEGRAFTAEPVKEESAE